jgi:2-(1,2-epoxy-1,2-dihydrophenyl)acetyl-CoA isomerase
MAEESGNLAVEVKRDAGVATITLARPSLSSMMKTALHTALTEVSTDETIRAVVLTGAGKAFCVGQDLAEHASALETNPATAFATIEEHYNPIVTALATMPKPVIAAINGTCVGAGLGFALACDIRIASGSARFGTAFTGIGLAPDSGLSVTLTRAVGVARASELILLAETFTAADALAWGVVGRLAPAGELHTTAQEIAARLAAGPARAYAEAKAALAAAYPLVDALDREGAAQARLGRTADHQGAVKAFLAKEKPEFLGR